jgi:hypothetical protein
MMMNMAGSALVKITIPLCNLHGRMMTKYNNKYYPHITRNGVYGYGDGKSSVSDKPLGPFEYQSHNSFSYKTEDLQEEQGMGQLIKMTKRLLACVYNCYWKNSKIILKDGNFGQQVLIKT